MITKTSLTHPSMIAKIKLAMELARSGEGDKMNGHGHRCYIQNRYGRNIMRLQWAIDGGYIVYGDCSKDITELVANALKQHYQTIYASKES